ncbi:MAG: hypothetical protein PVSMB4_06470 [Ktedonobacterales bacterium]
MIIVALALVGAAVVTGILVVARYALRRGQPLALAVLGRWAAALFVGNFLFDLLILYFAMPALTGPYLGWQWLLWPLLLSGVLALFGGGLSNTRGLLEMLAENSAGGANRVVPGGRRRPRIVDTHQPTGGGGSAAAGLFAIGLVFITLVVVNGLIVVTSTWFDANAKALAHIPRVIEERTSTPLPPTDVNHIVLVTQGVAAYLGQQVLGQNGQNLGSTYHTEPDSYTLQSVNHHLYWIAPLVYNNVFANLGQLQSPGYVVVDAEDPNVQPQLRTGYHLRYLPSAVLNLDLLRHVYLSGYTYGNLVDPTLEVRDDWRPYFTISLMQPTRGFTGDVVKQVLLVDPQTGGIQVYSPGDVPAWVDRIIPADTVTSYLTWWGKYNQAPWFNPAGTGQQVPATDAPELVYNSVDHPVWLVPMTSSARSDNSSTGVVLFDTHDNTGHFYPLAGLGVTSNVENTFKSNPHNLRNYDVGTVQLYQIYGVPTWVATFVQANTYGETYQAVGMVDARHLTGANVVMAGTKAEVLALYAQSLVIPGVGSGGPTSSGQQTQIQGKVTRISPATESGNTVYYLLIQGQTRIFRGNLSLSAELPLVQVGDSVQVSYIDTGQAVVTLTRFDDLDIHLATPTPGA